MQIRSQYRGTGNYRRSRDTIIYGVNLRMVLHPRSPKAIFIKRLRDFGAGRASLDQFQEWLVRDTWRGILAEGDFADCVRELEDAVFELAARRLSEHEVRECAGKRAEELALSHRVRAAAAR